MECCSNKLNAKQLSTCTSIWEYSWLPHICIDFWAKSAQWLIQGRAIIGQWGPFFKGLLLQSWKATATNRMYSSDLTAFGKKCWYFFGGVPFWCLVFDMFWCCTVPVLDLVISTYLNHVNGAKCLIHIHLCTESDFSLFSFHVFKRKTVQDCNDTPVPGTRPLCL